MEERGKIESRLCDSTTKAELLKEIAEKDSSSTNLKTLDFEKAMKILEKLQTIRPPELPSLIDIRHEFGRFNNENALFIPSFDSSIDMRFLSGVTKSAEEAMSFFRQAEFHLIAISKSGVGKTRMAFDVARHYFVIYMECISPSDISASSTRDKNYRKMYSEIEHYLSDGGGEVRSRAEQRIRLEITGRICSLLFFMRSYKDLTPLQALLLQINEGQELISIIIITIRYLDYLSLEVLAVTALEQMKPFFKKYEQKRIIFAIDEAGLPSETFKFWNSPRTGAKRGLLTAIARELQNYGHSSIYLGTTFSLGLGERLQSDIGKPNSIKILTKFV
eukprot:TRINITY_DN8269_c0_g1_i1.p1 TRINITY_DN8269_c0_g1~~TRINITY_DN8269_c0_g1_i1.p1  ORF type:complete len:353 (-),score=42.23 TRINITY_DN8269_c0_g1_i1:406-1404(-)